MKTRIRQMRRQRGWTLQELAERIGTTAQTVQRLETQNMTVSTDWLEKFGEAFGLDPVSLFADPAQQEHKVAGVIHADGTITPPISLHRETIGIDRAICSNPLVYWTADAAGDVPPGAYLAFERLEGRNIENVVGLNALAGLTDEQTVFGRVIRGETGRFTIVPPAPRADVRYDRELSWAGKPAAYIKLC